MSCCFFTTTGGAPLHLFALNTRPLQFVTPPEDPRSRHSSAGSEPGTAAPRSAPLSPFHSTGNGAVPSGNPLGRQRHQSAGGLPAATIHYRPQVLVQWTQAVQNLTFVKAWSQTNGDHSLVGDFVLNSEARSVSGDDCQVQWDSSSRREYRTGLELADMTNIFADTAARVWGPTMAISARHTAGRCCQPLSFIFFEQCELYIIQKKKTWTVYYFSKIIS